VAPLPSSRWKLRTVAPDLAARYRADGFWTDDTLGSVFAAAMAATPDAPVVFRSDARPFRGTIADLAARSALVAGALAADGVGPGDVVAFQAPNWIEAAATFIGAALAGASVVPIVHFYGRKEVTYVLADAQPSVVACSHSFRGIEHAATIGALRANLPDVKRWVVIGGDAPGFTPFDDWIADVEPRPDAVAVDPDDVALVAYTSGTTADPKGVIHTHRTILSEVRQLGELRATGDRPLLTGAPIGHGIGLLGGLLIPVARGDGVQYIDVWEPGAVLQAMLDDDVTAGSGSTFFLLSLLDHPDFGPQHSGRMTRIGLGGSTVPPAISERAGGLGISVVRSYGSTEHPSVSGGHHDDPVEKRVHTDGRTMPGVEMRIVDPDRTGAGEIWSRGPELFVGYTRPELTAAAFDDEGWYASGDVGRLDEDGYLTITDRKKDIIIRGGENVSAVEVEDLLIRVPGVAEVAVVAAPDERMGEHACAFVRLRPGAGEEVVGLDAIRAHLDAAGLARQKWPEEIRIVLDFPRTPSGKIQKFILRDLLRT
jgi:acyl-CoA synthetase (AMP-forming)/AMP-acid ligase II